MRTWMDVAVLAKANTTKGKFVAKAAAGFPFLLEDGDEIALVPPKLDMPRTCIVRDVTLIDDESASLSLGDMDPTMMRELVGMHCLIRRDALGEAAFQEPSALWDEWDVVDESLGLLGQVADIQDNGAQVLMRVSDGERDVLVPVVDEFVRDVDPEARAICVSLPESLVSLNT